MPITIYATNELTSIEVTMNKMRFSVNGTQITIPNYLYKGTTYVPLRAAAEALGKKVGWDGADGVSIDDPEPIKAPPLPTISPTPIPLPIPSEVPIPTETAADRMRELTTWVQSTVGIGISATSLPSSAVSSRKRMETWQKEFLIAMNGETIKTTPLDSWNFGKQVLRAIETATKMTALQ